MGYFFTLGYFYTFFSNLNSNHFFPIIDRNEIKTYLKSSGLENSKNIFSFIIRSSEKNLQHPKKEWCIVKPQIHKFIYQRISIIINKNKLYSFGFAL